MKCLPAGYGYRNGCYIHPPAHLERLRTVLNGPVIDDSSAETGYLLAFSPLTGATR